MVNVRHAQGDWNSPSGDSESRAGKKLTLPLCLMSRDWITSALFDVDFAAVHIRKPRNPGGGVFMKTDAFRLARFLTAQEHTYAIALEELHSGKKQSHWIWYVFPQLKGLGLSSHSEMYGLAGLAEARAYLANPILRHRLREATHAMLGHQSVDAASVLGELDALKFRSCLTLFSLADPSELIFVDALNRCFGGACDARTVELLKARGEVG
jgi:uncharacterized protein (DUF1810 family)